MRRDTFSDVTGTVLTDVHRGNAGDAIFAFWCDHQATQGYASRAAQPQFSALQGGGHSAEFFAVCGSQGEAVWVRGEPELSLDDIDFLWGAPATAQEVIPPPSLAADLHLISQLQMTDYRIVVYDQIGRLWSMLSGSVGPQPEPVVSAGESGTANEDVWSEQLVEAKQLAELTNDQLSRLFGVSRTSVQDWLAGRGMRGTNREHLRQVLTVLQDGHVRCGSSRRLHEALMVPVGDRHRRVFDYLVDKQYVIARGYLQHPVGVDRHRARRPIEPSVGLVEAADRLESLEQLSPSPRVSRDDE